MRYGGNICFLPDQHHLVDSLWVIGVRNRLLNDNLFVYLHKVHHSYVLAEWKLKPGDEGTPGVMLELLTFDSNPDELDEKQLPTDDVLRRRLSDQSELTRQAIAYDQARRDELKRLKDEAKRERHSQMRFLQRKAGIHRQDHPAVAGVGDGRRSWSTPELLAHQIDMPVNDFKAKIGL